MGLQVSSPPEGPAVLPALASKAGRLKEAEQQLCPSAPPFPHHTTRCKAHGNFFAEVEYS